MPFNRLPCSLLSSARMRGPPAWRRLGAGLRPTSPACAAAIIPTLPYGPLRHASTSPTGRANARSQRRSTVLA
jgi:hypothetical protein